MTSRSLLRSLAVACVAAAVSMPAFAADSSAGEDVGRFQLLAVGPASAGNTAPSVMMIDTRHGRVWMLDQSAERGYFIKRLMLERLDKAPEGMLTRPLVISDPKAK